MLNKRKMTIRGNFSIAARRSLLVRFFMNNSPLIAFFGVILVGIFVVEHYILIPQLVTPVTTSLKNHNATRLRIVQEGDFRSFCFMNSRSSGSIKAVYRCDRDI